MIGGMDPRQLQALMRQMGIKSEELSAKRVIIECEDKTIVIEEPQVVKVSMQGTESFQVSGKVKVEAAISEEDVEMVAERAGVSKEKARQALKECGGDIAEAILKLSGE